MLVVSACTKDLWILHFACRPLESGLGEIGEEIFCESMGMEAGVLKGDFCFSW